MTTGEYLLAKSSLNSGTALAHLLALQTGTGQGTVFASMFSVQIEQPSLTVTHRAKRQVQDAQVVSPPIRQSKSPKNVAVFSAVMSAVVFTAPDEITITQATQAVTLTTKQPSATITRKRK